MFLSIRPRAIVDNVYWVGVNDYVKDLFESLWPLTFGISYNAYTVIGRDGVALIDTVDERYAYEYIGKVKEVVGDFSKIRYIVVNHLEPDHHGATSIALELIPNAKLVTTSIGSKILYSIYRVPRDRVVVVKDGDKIDLGGKTLRFIYTPWLHWPETMVTYLEEDKLLFSCDAFGSYGALQNGLFDDELDMDFYIEEARRYFSNIVAKYTKNVLDAIKKLEKIDIKIIAPSHGPIYRSNPNRIVDLYKKWSQSDADKNRVLVIYGSMYGRGEAIVDRIVDRLRKENLIVVEHNASLSHPSYILSDLIESYTTILVYPSYDAGIFPYIDNILRIFQLKQVGIGRYVAIVNTYAWASTAKQATEMLLKAGFKIIEPVVETKAIPDEEENKKIEQLLNNIISISKQ